jgi:hypothetical protein
MTDWFTEEEAAGYLKVPLHKLARARYERKIAYAKPCGVVQYRKEDLDEYRESQWEESLKGTSSKSTHGRPSGTSSEEKRGASARVQKIARRLRNSAQTSYPRLIKNRPELLA